MMLLIIQEKLWTRHELESDNCGSQLCHSIHFIGMKILYCLSYFHFHPAKVTLKKILRKGFC